MGKCTYPQSRVYGLIEPGPVVLLTTLHKGKINVMPLSWHTMMEFEPPLVGCVGGGSADCSVLCQPGMPGRRHVSDDSL